MTVNKACILAAGRGTRFLPYTKAVSKEMIAVVDRPAISLIVDEVISSGIKDILIVISHDKEQIIKYFSPDQDLQNFLIAKNKPILAKLVQEIGDRANISYVFQSVANGSGEAVKLAKEFCDNSPCVILNGDDAIYNANKTATTQLIECYEKYNHTVIGVQQVTRQQISAYASCNIVASFAKAHLVDQVIEKPCEQQIKSLLAPLGRYVITPDFFNYLDKITPANNGELQFTDAINLQANKVGIYAYEFEGRRYDLGDKLGYLEAVVEYALRDNLLGEPFARYLKTLNNK
ncbi:MAG: UTP--glucose-1-phosphate uridylyltransferase [Clostridia bacterium]